MSGAPNYKEIVGVRHIQFDTASLSGRWGCMTVGDSDLKVRVFLGDDSYCAKTLLTPEQARFIARQLYRMARRVEGRKDPLTPA